MIGVRVLVGELQRIKLEQLPLYMSGPPRGRYK